MMLVKNADKLFDTDCILHTMKEGLAQTDSRYIWRYIATDMCTDEELEKRRLDEIVELEIDLEFAQIEFKDIESDPHLLSEAQKKSIKKIKTQLNLYAKNSLGFPTIKRLMVVRKLVAESWAFLEEVTKPG
jgi:hypothetical protein